jgi:hypothetical protein
MTNTATAPEQRASAHPLVGTWRLQSFRMKYEDTGEDLEPFGAHPDGYLSYGPDGRMYGIVVREGRKPPAGVPTDTEKIELFDGIVAYAGTYMIDGETVRHHVDISWIETWTGSTLVRRFRIDGNVLCIQAPAATDPLDGRLSSATLVWARVR